jgi:hypothetical protein
MIGNGDSDGSIENLFLHDDVATLAAYFQKRVPGENGADLFPGKNPELSQ